MTLARELAKVPTIISGLPVGECSETEHGHRGHGDGLRAIMSKKFPKIGAGGNGGPGYLSGWSDMGKFPIRIRQQAKYGVTFRW